MKKLITLFVVATILSCSNENQIQSDNANASQSSSAVLDGTMLSFKDDESFIKEYSILAELKSGKEVQDWISKKGHSSLLNFVGEGNFYEEDENGKIVTNQKNIYSDALKAILNDKSEFKVGSNVIWFYDQNFYLLNEENSSKSFDELIALKDDLELYGNVIGAKSKNSFSGRSIANANKSLNWGYEYNYDGRARKIVLTLFNETIYLSGDVKTTKMFLKGERLGRYCSTFKCRWNSDEGGQVFIKFSGNANWAINSGIYNYNTSYGYELGDNANTVLLADGTNKGFPYANFPDSFSVSGSVTATVINGGGSANPVYTNWTQQLSWY